MSHTRPNANQADETLDYLRSLDEKRLREDVIFPLLKKLDRKSVQLVHGSNERGKDFVYLIPDRLAGDLLCVCQVKSAKITGSASSADGINGVLRQLELAKNTLVLNPGTHQKELPQRVEFISTYPITDRVTSDLSHELNRMRQFVTFIDPERLAELVLEHLPQIVRLDSSKVSVFGALRYFVETNHEASAFNSNKSHLVTTLFVEPICDYLSDSNKDERNPELDAWTNKNVPLAIHRAVRLMWGQISNGDFTEPKAPCNDGEKERVLTQTKYVPVKEARLSKEELLVFKTISRSEITNALTEHIKTIRKQKGANGANQSNVCDFLDWARVFVLLLNSYVGRSLASFVEDIINTCVTGELAKRNSLDLTMRDLCEAECDLAIVGPAGFGKTFLTRAMSIDLLDLNAKCLFFPCKTIDRDYPCRLKPAISLFLENISGMDESTIESSYNDLDLSILDGCDEAPTYPKELGADIRELYFDATSSSAKIPASTNLFIPEFVQSRVEVVHRNKETTLKYHGRLSPWERRVLLVCNEEGAGESLAQKTIAKAIELARRKTPKRLVLSSRSVNEMGVFEGVITLTIRPFNDSQLRSFYSKRLARPKGKEVMEFLMHNPGILEVARTPMMASIIAGLKDAGIPLPNSRPDIYDKRFDLLLGGWDVVRGVDRKKLISDEDKKRFLQKLAYKAHTKQTQKIPATSLQGI